MNQDMDIVVDFCRFIREHADELTDVESLKRLNDQFMAEHNSTSSQDGSNKPPTVRDYLELASKAKSKKKKLKYVKKAQELEPDNLEVALREIELTKKHAEERMPALQALIEKGNQQMEEAGNFDTDALGFWLCRETPPYMKVRYVYLQFLLDNGMIRRACEEGERMLGLCDIDPYKVHYTLMHIYAYMENETAALALHKKYDNDPATQMLLPLAILYYKVGDFQRAGDYLKSLCKFNKDTKKFVSAVVNHKLGDYMEKFNPDKYRSNGMDELLYAYYYYLFLYATSYDFFKWGHHVLKSTAHDKERQ